MESSGGDPDPDPSVRGPDPESGAGSAPKCHGSPTLMESTAHYFSGVMFYRLQSSAYFLNDMLIVNSLSSTHLQFGRLIILATEK
jgi:hypothetical protein